MKDTQVSPATAQRLYDAGYPKPKPPKTDYPTGLEIIDKIIDRVIIIYDVSAHEIWTSAGRHKGVDFAETCAEAYIEWTKTLPF